MGEKWPVISTESCDFHAYTSGFFYMPQICDMGQTALLPFRRLRPGFNPRTCVPKASSLPLDHRSRSHCSNSNVHCATPAISTNKWKTTQKEETFVPMQMSPASFPYAASGDTTVTIDQDLNPKSPKLGINHVHCIGNI